MKMPETIFVSLGDADRDHIDPADLPETKPDDTWYQITETAEEAAETNATVTVAEYRLVRMVEVTSTTTVNTVVNPK